MQLSVFPRPRFCGSHLITQDLIIASDEVLTPHHLERALNYLQENRADLVKGDLIVFEALSGYRNQGIAIYDGEEIIGLNYSLCDYGALPLKFRVIEEGVPLDYWIGGEVNLGYNSIVWFDHSLVRVQCLENLTYARLSEEGGKYAIFTSFSADDRGYQIVFSNHLEGCLEHGDIDKDDYHFFSEDLKDRKLERLREILLADKLVPFLIESKWYSGKDSTLYIEGGF
jgi:hypothetical protein